MIARQLDSDIVIQAMFSILRLYSQNELGKGEIARIGTSGDGLGKDFLQQIGDLGGGGSVTGDIGQIKINPRTFANDVAEVSGELLGGLVKKIKVNAVKPLRSRGKQGKLDGPRGIKLPF